MILLLLTIALLGLASPDKERNHAGRQLSYPYYQGAQPISWKSTTPAPPATTAASTTTTTTTTATLPSPIITSVATVNPYNNYYNNIYSEYYSNYINVPMYVGAHMVAVHPNKTQLLQMQKPPTVFKEPVILPPVPPPQTPPPPLPIPVPAKPSDIRPDFVMVPHTANK